MNKLPDVVNLDGHIDSLGIEYVGDAKLQDNDKYAVLAKVPNRTGWWNSLCIVEVNLTFENKNET
jgi:hypothetical protein